VSDADNRFRFVQLDVPGRLGLDDGRYLVRSDQADQAETVLVVQTLGGAIPARRRRRRRPRRVERDADPPEVPFTRLTVIAAERLESAAAARGLERATADADAAEASVVGGLRAANAVLRAHRVATHDPYGHEIGREAALAARVGYGTGEGLAEGRWDEAVEVPHPERRERRAQALRPQERLAAVLAGRERIDACETLLLRARADVEQGRTREAALQLRAGLEALLTEIPADGAEGDQARDLAVLQERFARIAATAREALGGELDPERASQVADTLGVCERVLRRRQILAE